ncbi:MAG: hypothetical protein HWE16_17105 [Gammaproteobacteria bacterium]|nr:hypothetical protein [Gammaproteobacteria bacterium]
MRLLNSFLIALVLVIFIHPIAASEQNTKIHRLEFSLPSDQNQPPQISRGAATIFVDAGDEVELSVSGDKNTIMLIIESEQTPFASGKYRVTINSGNGNSKKLIIADRPGAYKYSIVDISERRGSAERPVLDPVIIIKN